MELHSVKIIPDPNVISTYDTIKSKTNRSIFVNESCLSESEDETIQPACYDTGETTTNTAHSAHFAFMSPHESVAADTANPDMCTRDKTAGPLLSD